MGIPTGVNFHWEMSSEEIPLQSWIAKFNLTMGGLEPCAIPPSGS
jgi:hypothetical protein